MDDRDEELGQNTRTPREVIESHKGSNLPHQKIGGAPQGLETALRKRAIKTGVSAAATAAKVPKPVTDTVMASEQGEQILDEAVNEPTVTQGVAYVVSQLTQKATLYITIGAFAFFGLIFLISSVYLVKNTNNLNYASGQFYANEEYKKVYETVEQVVSDVSSKYGVKVDKYLIIAALTAYQGNEIFMDDTESDTYDSIDVEIEETSDDGSSSVVSKNMSKMESYARLLAMYQIKTTTSCSASSDTPRQIASNDDSVNFLNFWKESSAREKNYDCSGGSGKSYSLSIEEGKYTDDSMGGVFYWNLIDEDFLTEYYANQLKGIGEEETRTHTKALMTEYIYLYARTLAELDSCNTTTSDLQTNFTTVYAECPGVKVVGESKIYPLEEYVAGVIAAEVSPGYMSAIISKVGGTQEQLLEFYKAFTIATRTYTINRTNNCANPIRNSSQDQNFSPTDNAVAWKAVNETEGMVLTMNGKIFSTEYDSYNCPGSTSCTYTKIPGTTKHTVTLDSRVLSYAAGGHGRGLSQIAATDMAAKGKNYQEILKFFYDDNAEIQILNGSNGPSSTSGSTTSTATTTAFCSREAASEIGEGTCDEKTEYKGKKIEAGPFQNNRTMTLLACTADQAEKAFKEIAANCGPIPEHAGSIRDLNATVNQSRSATSFHYTGRAFDLNTNEGMQAKDTYFYVTLDNQSSDSSKNYYRLYCKAIDGAPSNKVKEQTIIPVKYANSKIVSKSPVTDKFFDVTDAFNTYGITGIGPRKSCMDGGDYMCTEWWHFQDVSGLVKGQTEFKTTLSQYYGYAYDFKSTGVAGVLGKKWNGGSFS